MRIINMKYSRLLPNGQIVIRRRLQLALGIKPGDQLTLELVKGELVVRPTLRKGASQVTVTATQFRIQMFKLMDQLGDGELDRVIVTHSKLPPIQILYDGHVEDADPAQEATSL